MTSLHLHGLLFLAGLLAGSSACVRPASYPLYPPPVQARDQVSTLSGPIIKVDGQDVPPKPSYALLPGCHIVVLPAKIGEGSPSGAWSSEVRHPVYVIDMKPGRLYDIRVHLEPGSTNSVGNGNVGSVSIRAVEQDSSGKVLATVEPVRKRTDPLPCQPPQVE